MMVRVGFWQGFEVKPEAIHDEKILDVVGLLELIEDGFIRIGAHAGDAGFRGAPSVERKDGRRCEYFFAPAASQHFSGGVAHVLDHGAFVFRRRNMWIFRTGMP